MIGRNAENTRIFRRFVGAAVAIVAVAALLIFLFVDGSFLESDDLPKDTTADLASRSAEKPTNVTRRRDAADALESARRKENERDRRRLGGTVVDTDGRPADAVTIKLIDPADATGTAAEAALQFTPTPSRAEAVTDSAGRFELFAPSDGRFIIVARRGPAEFSELREITAPTTSEIDIVLRADDALPCIALDDQNLAVSGVEIAVVRSRRGGIHDNFNELIDREIIRSDDRGIFHVPVARTSDRGLRTLAANSIRHEISIGARRNADATARTWIPQTDRKDDLGRCVLFFEKTTPLTIKFEFDGGRPPEDFVFSLSSLTKRIRRTFSSSHGEDAVWTDCPAITLATVDVHTATWQVKFVAGPESEAFFESFAQFGSSAIASDIVDIPRLEESPRVLKLTFDRGHSIRVRFVESSTKKFVTEISASIVGEGRRGSTAVVARSGKEGVLEFANLGLDDYRLTIDTLDWTVLKGPWSHSRSHFVLDDGIMTKVGTAAVGRPPTIESVGNPVNPCGISVEQILEGAVIDIEVARSCELIGRVVDADENPIAAATLALLRESDHARPVHNLATIDDVLRRTSATTAADGRFRIRGFTPEIGFVLKVEAEDSQPKLLSVAGLAPNEVRDIGTISLSPDHPWTLRLVRPSGQPLIGIGVAVHSVPEKTEARPGQVIMLPGGTTLRPDRQPISIERTDARGEVVVRRIVVDRVLVSLLDRPAGVHLPGDGRTHECVVDRSKTHIIVVNESPVLSGRLVPTKDERFADVTVTAIPSTIPTDEIEKARKDGRDIGDPNGSTSEQRDFRRALRGSARVQPDGSFEIELTASGEYTLEVTGRGVNFSREDRTLGGSLLSSVVELYEVDRPFAVTGRENPPIKVKRIGPRIPATAIEMASEESVSRAREFFPQYFEK